jgi:hypothetical protein
MIIHELVDELYRAFVGGLGNALAARARNLPQVLRLTTGFESPWSQVFAHEVTLGAPALLAEAIPLATASQVRDAVLAHMLAVIEAFGVDRIEDEQIEASAPVLAVLGHAKFVRDGAMARLCHGPIPPELDFAGASALVLRAIRRERSALLSARPVDIAAYERASHDKQCIAWLATQALAQAAGCDGRRTAAVKATLQSVAAALQAYDDVVDWEEDVERGGSWAICLMKAQRREAIPREGAPESSRIRGELLRSGVLGLLLERAVYHIRAARRRATALGAARLAAWAASREARFEGLVQAERRSAGYAVRAHALAAWAGEVLP